MRLRVMGAVVVAWFGCGLISASVPASASAASGSKSEGALVFHPRFERVRGSYLVDGGRYVFIGRGLYSPTAGVLIDGRTRRSRKIASPGPGCKAFAVGAPWVAFECGPTWSDPALYSIPSGRFQPFTALAPYPADSCTTDCLPIAAIGTDWVAFLAPAADPEHGFPSFEFQNLQSGRVIANDPANSTTSIDLNAPQLTQSICPPLSLPVVSRSSDGLSGWGSLTFDDGFAITSGDGGAYLERCGSPMHEFLTYTTPNQFDGNASCPYLECAPANNGREIVWQSGPGRVSGIFLKDRRRFTIQPPPNLADAISPLALTPTRLYLAGGDSVPSHIWSIPAPTEPPKPRHT